MEDREKQIKDINQKLERLNKRLEDQLKILNSGVSNLDRRISSIREDLLSEIRWQAEEIFSQGEFIDKAQEHLVKYAIREFDVRLKDDHFHSLINELVVNKIRDNFEELLNHAIDRIFKNMKKDLDYQLHLTKTLCYSIDQEIKKCTSEHGIGSSEEKALRNVIQKFSSPDNKILEIQSGELP